MCDKLTTPPTCVNCAKGTTSPGGSTTCSTTLKWMYDCSSLTGKDKGQCHACNRKLVFDHVLDIMALVIPASATYGEWLGGVTDPDLNALIKAFTGTLVIDVVLNAS